MRSIIQAVVLTGYGINCENEMALACQLAGAHVKKMHLQTLFRSDFPWNETQLLLFPGGFSFGDELGAAKTLANRLSYHSMKLRDRLLNFVEEGHCILGICNGFQLLVKLGLLPGADAHSQTLSLACNDSGRFECRWAHHLSSSFTLCFYKRDREFVSSCPSWGGKVGRRKSDDSAYDSQPTSRLTVRGCKGSAFFGVSGKS